ncbi:WD40 repeat domain-containing protein [Flavilitoribacter nigricans]|uniref:WD40 repeat domain-containing protein n=1 Tax=Flavilitoribacter nigricans (strain ATCC 23147 / DSM 23189 / NBRC 102662 / NCIMB 1420 / SS-2) TaxID=1122177 RepID=A0A2D0N1G0_FLAN2|nr:hypothetical protein [Flavilitoribacter nigricans]PHN02206.1 hypothetical protein CRP01_33265 [Flavilitoribacter nigricans DSM 23189 = NBRC 102662]
MSKLSEKIETIEGLNSMNAFVDAELSTLEQQSGAAARKAGEAVLERLTSESGTLTTLSWEALEKLLHQEAIKPSALPQAMESLLKAGLVTESSGNTLRLSSNTLALALQQRFLGRRTIRRETSTLIRGKYDRKELLSDKELTRVMPALPYLDLTHEEMEFVRKSDWVVKRRRWMLQGAVVVVILLLLGLAWSLSEQRKDADEQRKDADKARQVAEEKQQEALDSAEIAKKLRADAQLLADSLRIERDSSVARRDRAESNETKALKLSIIAKRKAEEADTQKVIALKLNDILRMQLDTVNKYRDQALKAVDTANHARKNAEALSLIIKSQNVALSVPQLPADSVNRKAILAYQAFDVNNNTPLGNIYNDAIYKALYHGLQSLSGDDSDRIENVHQESPLSIVAVGDRYYSAGMDGTVKQWAFGGPPPVQVKGIHPEVHNQLTTSDDEEWLLICSRLPFVQLFNTRSGVRKIVPYPNKWGATGAWYESESKKFLLAGYADSLYWINPESKVPNARTDNQQSLIAIARIKGNYVGFDRNGKGFLNGRAMSEWPGGLSAIAAATRNDQLAFGDKDGNVYIDTTGSGVALLRLQVHRSAIVAIQYSPDALFQASLARDGKVGIINVKQYLKAPTTYQPILLDLPGLSATAIAFSRDSRELLLGTEDGRIVRFYLDPRIYADRICRLLRDRGLDSNDWQKPWVEHFQEKIRPPACN